MKKLIFAIMMVGCVSTANAFNGYDMTADPVCSQLLVSEVFENTNDEGQGIVIYNGDEYKLDKRGIMEWFTARGSKFTDPDALERYHKWRCEVAFKKLPIKQCLHVAVGDMYKYIKMDGRVTNDNSWKNIVTSFMVMDGIAIPTVITIFNSSGTPTFHTGYEVDGYMKIFCDSAKEKVRDKAKQ